MKYIDDNMSYEDIFSVLSGNLPNSYNVLNKISEIDRFDLILRELDFFDIIGDRIYKLYHFCSNDNIYDFSETMLLIRLGAFSYDEIYENLSNDEPIPFLDKDEFYYFDLEDKQPNGREKMNDYIARQRESYLRRKVAVLKK